MTPTPFQEDPSIPLRSLLSPPLLYLLSLLCLRQPWTHPPIRPVNISTPESHSMDPQAKPLEDVKCKGDPPATSWPGRTCSSLSSTLSEDPPPPPLLPPFWPLRPCSDLRECDGKSPGHGTSPHPAALPTQRPPRPGLTGEPPGTITMTTGTIKTGRL